MRSFLANSACNGYRPKGAGKGRRHPRPRLMKRLMEDRRVARFVVAPMGYGKSSLAAEYADSIFGFRNVFWVDCLSPCFLRDLDAGLIAQGLLTLSSSSSLAIFEDVPYLDDERAEAFSGALDCLLSEGWEVVATMLPPYDAFGERQSDRLVLDANDLLVDDVEADSSCGVSSEMASRKAERVAALVWGGSAERDSFLDSLKAAEMPAEMRLAALVALVLQDGTFEDLGALVRGLKCDSYRFLARHYPHLGIDLVSEEFSSIRVPLSRISRSFAPLLEETVERAAASGRDSLSMRLADLLVERGLFSRACETMGELCARKRRLSWIVRSHAEFVACGQVALLQDLFEGLGRRPSGLTPRALVDAAMRLKLLGDGKEAAKYASRAMSHPDSTLRIGCEAALLCDECGSGETAEKAERILERASALPPFAQDGQDDDLGILGAVAASRLRMRDDLFGAIEALEPYEDSIGSSEAALSHLSFLLACSNGHVVREGWATWSRDSREAAKSLATRCLGFNRSGKGGVGLLGALVMNELVSGAGWPSGDDARERAAESAVVGLMAQREEWGRRRRREKSTESARRAPSGDDQGRSSIPEMNVRLFGGMEVSIGGVPLGPDAFRKQRARTLLAVLVLHRGKEVPRRELLDIMWPASDWDRAVSNFYSLWSVLRKALSDEEGNCPYLVRHRSSCMVDSRLVTSDVDEFEELYRRLVFDAPDPRAWMGVFERLSSGFLCDLIPSESDNLYIEGMREKYRTRTVDACITAAMRLCDIQEPQVALWFAHAAFEVRGAGEDAYYALMRAQMMAGRRTSAMETYFSCLRFMGDELGMGPSERMVRLYDELLVGAGEE